jgi:hypothetical protein
LSSYLERVVTKHDKDKQAVMRNLAPARRANWPSMRRVLLVRDAADPKTVATFYYRTVVLYVLRYGIKSWVLTGDLMRKLRSFHRRVCQCRLTGEFI